MAVGNNAVASHTNSVAIGNGSSTSADNTVSVGSAGSNRRVTNVAAGVDGTDAVNVDQLNAGQSSALSSANADADAGDVDAGDARTLDAAMQHTNAQIASLRKEAFAGIAQAAALVPMAPSGEGETTLNVGVASYGGRCRLRPPGRTHHAQWRGRRCGWQAQPGAVRSGVAFLRGADATRLFWARSSRCV